MSEPLTEQQPDLSEAAGKPKVQPPARVTGEWCPNCGRNEVVDVPGVGHGCNLCGHQLERGDAKAAAAALGVPTPRAARKPTRRKTTTAAKTRSKRKTAARRKKATTTKGGT